MGMFVSKGGEKTWCFWSVLLRTIPKRERVVLLDAKRGLNKELMC